MASINPNLPPIHTRGLTSASPLKATPPPPPPDGFEAIPAPAWKPQPPKLEANGPGDPRPSGSGKKALLAMAGLGLLAGGALVGGALGPVVSQSTPETAQTQVQGQHTATQSLELQSARFGTSPTVRSFGEAPASVSHDSYRSTKGSQSHEVSIDRLDRADGHALYSSEDAELSTLDFHDQGTGDWITRSQLRPAGNFERFVSVAETTTLKNDQGTTVRTQLRTVDTQTKDVANLSQLLSPEDYQQVAQSISSRLNSLEGISYQQPDMESLDSHMNQSFALNQEKDGSVTLSITIGNQMESQSGKVAEFNFRLDASRIQR